MMAWEIRMHTIKVNGSRCVCVDFRNDVQQLFVGQLVVHGGQNFAQRRSGNETIAY